MAKNIFVDIQTMNRLLDISQGRWVLHTCPCLHRLCQWCELYLVATLVEYLPFIPFNSISMRIQRICLRKTKIYL